MTQNSLTDDDPRSEPGDPLDRLLSNFFKAELKQPWPAALLTPATEPSSVLAARAVPAEAPRNQPASARDSGSKSRYTLAASVALLLGTCWYFSNGFQPTDRPGPAVTPGGGMLKDAGASKPPAVEELHKDNALKGNHVIPRPPIKLP